MKQFNPSMSVMNRSNVAPEQSAKIQAAAAALREQKANESLKQTPIMSNSNRQNNAFSIQPVVVSEAASAMKWANQYDKSIIREAYLQGKTLPPKPTSMVAEQESVTGSQQSLTEAPALRPTSSANNRHTMAPSTASTNGRSSPAPEKRHSLNASPQSQASSTHSKAEKDGKAKVSRLRAMFGKKEAEAMAPSSHLAVPMGFDAARRPSLRRKHSPMQASTPAQAQPEPVTTPKPAPEPEKEQVIQQTFNSFDQGPLDAPAFVPDSPDLSNEASESPAEVSKPITNDVSEVSPPVSPVETNPAPMQDRWAQIRKNAAERAKANAAKQSEDLSTTTDAPRTDIDDGETSGEESMYTHSVQVELS